MHIHTFSVNFFDDAVVSLSTTAAKITRKPSPIRMVSFSPRKITPDSTPNTDSRLISSAA